MKDLTPNGSTQGHRLTHCHPEFTTGMPQFWDRNGVTSLPFFRMGEQGDPGGGLKPLPMPVRRRQPLKLVIPLWYFSLQLV